MELMLYWLQQAGVAVSAVAGVLAARGRGVDLFGVIVLALVSALGGGTLRDLCLGAVPLFWIEDARYVWTAVGAALVTFVWARRFRAPVLVLEVADAMGLAMFTILGAQKSLAYGTNGTIAVVMGTITGVAGGVLRDVLLNELPLVFRREIRLYATAAGAGAVVYVLMKGALPAGPAPALVGTAVGLAVRLAAIRWKLALPLFLEKPPERGG